MSLTVPGSRAVAAEGEAPVTGVAGVAGDAQVQGAVTSGDVKKGASVRYSGGLGASETQNQVMNNG